MGAKTWNLQSMGSMQRKLDALNWLVEVSVVMNSTVQLQPLLVAIVLQLFSYHAAVKMGKNVDRPRNLAKSVTVE